MRYQDFLKPLNYSKHPFTAVNGWLLIFTVNRLQVGYTILFIPAQLVSGSHYWIILLAFMISQLNLFMISKWIDNSKEKETVKLGSLLPKIITYPILVIGLSFLLLKFFVILIGYTKIIEIYLVPEQRRYVILLVLFVLITYLASKGAHQIVMFSFFAFLFSGWILFAYLQFFFSPFVSIRELFPIIDELHIHKDVNSLIYILSGFSGPELLLFLKKWMKEDIKTYKFLTIGNIATFIEYSFLFILAVLFFGSNYLVKIEYPLVTMAKYIQTPYIDRLEMVIIPFFAFPLIYSLSMITLFMFKSLQYSLRFKENRLSFVIFIVIIGCITLYVQRNYWGESSQEKIWISYYVYLTSFMYTLLPLGFLLIKRVKKT